MSNDNKRVNEAFIRGYERGKKDGEREALSEKDCRDCRHFVGCECFSGMTCDQFEKNVVTEGEDIVSRPKYYNDSKITPFDVIDDWKLDFYLGNAVKYIKRAGKKDGNSRLQDLKKIRTYVDEAIKREEASGK